MLKKKSGAPPNNKNAKKEPNELRKARSFKTTDEEYEIIRTKAKNAKMSISEFIRHRTISK